MSSRCVFRPDCKLEPIVSGWPAWSGLIPPHAAARYLKHWYIEIMQSYVEDPDLHAIAASDPELSGGPWVDFGRNRSDEVKALLEETKRSCAELIELAGAIEEVDQLIQSEATGFALEPLYPKVPALLRGLVELVYDINEQPGVRFLEPLIYRSALYRPSAQRAALSLLSTDSRPFQWSTPLLQDGATHILDIPFADERWDRLAKARRHAVRPEALAEELGVGEALGAGFGAMFARETPRSHEPVVSGELRVRYIGHACVLVETRGSAILIDPVIPYELPGLARYSYLDLPERIDLVLITHAHNDHVALESLLQLRHRVGEVVVPRSGGGSLQDPSLKLSLRQIGFPRVREVDSFDEVDCECMRVTAVPFLGEHCDLDIRSKSAYALQAGNRRLLFLADSRNLEPGLYGRLAGSIGHVDQVFLGMECEGSPLSWGYGPLLTRPIAKAKDRSRRTAASDCAGAMAAVEALGAPRVCVYALGHEPWLRHIIGATPSFESEANRAAESFLRGCADRGIASEKPLGRKQWSFALH